MRSSPLPLLSAIALAVLPTRAQDPTRAEPRPEEPPAAAARFDIDFQGGTLQEMVEALKAASGIDVKTVIHPDDAGRKLPPLRQKSVTVPDAFRMLSVVSAGAWRPMGDPGDPATLWVFNAQPPPPGNQGGPGFPPMGMGPGMGRGPRAGLMPGMRQGPPGMGWRGAYPPPPARGQVGPGETRTIAFALKAHLTQYTIDDVITAIESALEMGEQHAQQGAPVAPPPLGPDASSPEGQSPPQPPPSAEPGVPPPAPGPFPPGMTPQGARPMPKPPLPRMARPQLKFHMETSILLVSGSSQAIETVESVLAALLDNVETAQPKDPAANKSKPE